MTQPFNLTPLDASFGAIVTELRLADLKQDAFDQL